MLFSDCCYGAGSYICVVMRRLCVWPQADISVADRLRMQAHTPAFVFASEVIFQDSFVGKARLYCVLRNVMGKVVCIYA